MEKIILRKAALLVFKEGKVLMARSKKNEEIFYTLGGKYEADESDEECLTREVMEEVGCAIKPGSIKFLREFEDVPHGPGKEDMLLVLRVFTGELIGEPVAQSEVAEIRYFDASIDPKHLTSTSKQIFAWLTEKKML